MFAAFAATGSAYQVVAAFAGRRFPLRAYGGAWAGQLRWGRLNHARVLGILNNPCYAGAYVFGRYAARRTVRPGRQRALGRSPAQAMADWQVLIHDHHPGYLSWEDYLANQAKTRRQPHQRRRPPGPRRARVVSGHHRLRQLRTADVDALSPQRARRLRVPSPPRTSRPHPTCRSISAEAVDAAVAERLLAALNPEEVALALAAADEVTARRARASRAAELAVERARYEADRAERAFHAAEPENRLVVRTLETRWETKLTALAEAEAALAATEAAAPPLPARADLEALVADLPGLWAAPTTTARDRKRLLRTLIADVTLLPEPDPDKRPHRGALAHRRHRRDPHPPGRCRPARPAAPRPPRSS